MAVEASERVLVYAPIGRDGAASAALLQRAGISAVLCADTPDLLAGMERGAAAVFVAEEGLFKDGAGPLIDWVRHQPTWSDLPFVVLTSHQAPRAIAEWRQSLVAGLRNVSLIERPVQPITLTSTIQAAIRARARQYEMRVLLEARERAAQQLERLVAERTCALQEANAELLTQMAERARVEEALRHAQKMEAIGQLTGGVAHDFNNLLMVIAGGLEMLRGRPDPKRRERLMDGMRLATQRGSALTKQLLAFSRRQTLKPQTVDLADLIGGMRELLDRSLRGDMHVAFAFADDLWSVDVDPDELQLVVLNLAVNARDAMPNGGTISVRARNEPALSDGELSGDYVCLSVTDTGTGMTPEVMRRAFEPFFTTKDVGEGSGLGLAQAHGFSKQSGGTVRIESELGRGTTLSLFLPASKGPPLVVRPATDDDARVEPRAPGASGSVLLVEDDDAVAALVADMMADLGYEVDRVASAEAALDALATGRPVDAVFSDVMMPGGMNGVQLAEAIRTRHRTLPVLLTSGYADPVRPKAAAIGIRILSKPYRLRELAEALKTIVPADRPSRPHQR
jgi:signal transduction histidine kinase/ActR/RegA family two-component response regulator